MVSEEENTVFHLPADEAASDAVFDTSALVSDQALFDELNAVSEEVLECRNRILSKIS